MSRCISRRDFLVGATTATAALAAAACVSSPTPQPVGVQPSPTTAPEKAPAPTAAQAAPTAAPAVQIARGGKLRYAQGIDVMHLAPWSNTAQSGIFYALYDTLVKRDFAGNFHPALATSWQFSDDGRVVTFDLREGVKFHSGRDFSAESIEPAFKYLLEGGGYNGWLSSVEKYEVTGKYQVKLHLTGAISPILTFLDMAQVPDPDDLADIKTKGTGTGPFKLAEWRQGDVVRLVRNENYWQKDYPLLDEIEYKVWPERTAMISALETGYTDIAYSPPYQDLPRLADNKDLQVGTALGLCVDVEMNLSRKPFDSKKVRQGIAWACDRQRFVDTYLYGFGEVWETPVPEGYVGWAPDLKGKIGFDLAKAKDLIAEGGYPNGFESTMMIGPESRVPGAPTMAEILQADLKKIGVNLKIELVESTVANDRRSTTDYDIHCSGYSRLKESGELFQAALWRKDNWPGFRSDEYSKLIDDGMATIDAAKRQEIYHRLFEIGLDECWCIPIGNTPRTIAYRKSVQDFEWSADGYLRPAQIWLSA